MFTDEHKKRISDALKLAWKTKRKKSEIGEKKLIDGKLRERVISSNGWIYWRTVRIDPRNRDLSSAGRSYWRKKGLEIPKRKPGPKPGSRQAIASRLKRSVSMRKYLFDVRSIAREQKERIRKSFIYRFWRESVFARDNYTCQHCGARNGNGSEVHLQAHHKKSYAKFPSFRFDINNGQTLCEKCHSIITRTQMLRNKNGHQRESSGITQMTIPL